MTTFAETKPGAAAPAARILVVEDERIVAMSLREKLEGMGYVVPALAASGEDAVARADELRPDLVLMDIHLEGKMDGIEAARIVRDRLRIPVVYLTAYSNREVVERAKVTEPFGYILKPYVDRELQVIIEMALYRSHMERKLLEQKRLLAATLRSIGDGVIATDSDGRVTYLNPMAERLTGWSLADALGRPVREVFTLECEKTRRPVEPPLERAMRERQVGLMTDPAALVARDERRVPIDDSSAPILGEAEALLGGVVVFRDATEQRAAARSAAELAAIVASVGDAIIGQTVDGVVTSWNAAAERLYGYAAAEAVGRNVAMLAAEGSEAEILDNLARVRRGEQVPPHEALRRHKNGRTLAVMVTESPIKNEAGEVVGAAAVVRDMAEIRGLEQQFRQAQKLETVGRLCGGVAHDFNNLLTAINGYTCLVLSGLAPHDPNREMLEQVLRAGERAASLTYQLLAYSRKQVLQPLVLDLNGLVCGAEKMLRRIVGEDVEFRLDLGGDLRLVKVDPVQMEQVLMNLAVNARDAMPEGGVLTIETAVVQRETAPAATPPEVRSGPYVVLTVRDTGCGMDKDVMAHLFEPFFTTKEVGKGTGLGLATAYGIVKQSGGHIEVESLPGRGSTFRIYLPAAEEGPAAGPAPEAESLPCGTETVLLVEDEEGVRKLTAHVLKESGYTVLEAEGGAEALEAAANHKGKIDLLVTDVVMPQMNGPQVAEAVRVVHPAVKVLFQSGYTDDALARHGVTVAEPNYIQKPFTLSQLARKVREALDG